MWPQYVTYAIRPHLCSCFPRHILCHNFVVAPRSATAPRAEISDITQFRVRVDQLQHKVFTTTRRPPAMKIHTTRGTLYILRESHWRTVIRKQSGSARSRVILLVYIAWSRTVPGLRPHHIVACIFFNAHQCFSSIEKEVMVAVFHNSTTYVTSHRRPIACCHQ
jgi:hypothetical protein